MGIDAFIDEVKSRLDIVDVVSLYVPLKRVGRNYQGLCPFHIEKTPSFTVSPERQMFYCFGCGVGGDVIKFIQLIEGLDFLEALERAADMAGMSLEDLKLDLGPDREKKSRLKKLHGILAEAFCSFLKTDLGKGAREYLKKRGVSPLWWEVFRIGFAPEGMDFAASLMKRGFTREELTASGIFYPKGSGLVCRFAGRLMIPICDFSGDVVAFGGRIIGEGEPKYLNSPESPIFQKGKILFGFYQARERIRSRNRVILVEGYMDVISMHAFGFAETVASLGTAFTKDQAVRISRLTRNVYILYDGDSAGRKATLRAAKAFYAVGIEPKVVLLPEGSDPDDFVRAKGADALGDLIEQAKGPIDLIAEEVSKGSLSKGIAVERAMELIDEVVDPVLVDSVLSYVSEIFKLPLEDLKASYLLRKRKKPAFKRDRKESRDASSVGWERRVMIAIIRDPVLYERWKDRLAPELFMDRAVAKIAKGIASGKTPEELMGELEGEAAKILGMALFNQDDASYDPPDEDCWRKLESRALRYEAEQLKRMAATAAASERRRLMRLYMEKIKESKAMGGGIP